MKSIQSRQTCLGILLVTLLLTASGCTDDFYLSEKEVVAYTKVLDTESSANLYFDNVQARSITLLFDNSSGTPRLQSSNLLAEMRRTEMLQLESGLAGVQLPRLASELEKQIGNWVEGRLQLYTSTSNDSARLKRLDSVSIQFLTTPTFTYHPERQSIDFDLSFAFTINGTIEVNAINWLVDLFTNINGTYPIAISITYLRLQGEVNLLSPYANAGRVRFQMLPQNVGAILANPANSASVPNQVLRGVEQVLTHNLSARVDEIFYQDYEYFSLPRLSISPGTATTSGRLQVNYRSKIDHYGPAESTDPALHLVSRATDGKLYHARRGNGGWGESTAIPFPSPSPTPYPRIDNDPTLFYSGGGQMDLAATDVAGDLVYAHWRDEAWGNWQIVKPNITYTPAISYRGKPAVVATAPGQAEVITVGSDGALWHLRRLNGGWQPPTLVRRLFPPNMSLPLRNPAATIIGGDIVIVYVDALNHLFGQVFDTETGVWGSPMGIQTQETVRYGPVAATWADETTDQIIVVYVGQSGIPYSHTLDINVPNPTFSFGPEKVIGGVLNAAPVLVASGYRQLELIGHSSGDRLQHNHCVNALAPFSVDGRTINPGWQGWTGLNDNFPGSGAQSDGHFAEFSAAATPSGRVELTARAYVSPGSSAQPYVYHNNYESKRYGRALWKAVHWRGYQVAGSQTGVGQPALVAMDRNFQVGFIGHYSGVGTLFNYAQLSASNLTMFTGGPPARASAFHINPVTLSTGLGTVDRIYVGADGRLHHNRTFSNNAGRDYPLTLPAGLSLANQLAAVSYGNSFIELATTLSDGCVYHWRFRDGSWSNPTGVACHIASAPALVYTGPGQLELLAVDVDHKLYRWRYLGTSWVARLAIASDFFINENLFGPTAVSSWGDGTLDVVVVNRDTRALYHRRVGPDDEICTLWFGCPAPRVFNKLGGSVEDRPVLTAFSPTNLNVLTMGGLQWFSNWASREPFQPITIPPLRDPLLRWSGFQFIGGTEMVVGAAAHTGPRNYAAVAIDFDGSIFINRYQEGRWTGFQPIVGQTPDMRISSPLILPTLAANGG